MRKLVLWKGAVAAIDHFIDEFCIAAEKRGIVCYIADIEHTETFQNRAFFDFIRSPSTAVLTFNQVGARIGTAENNLYELYNVPVYSFILDHPRYFHSALEKPITNTLRVICLDKNHVKYVRKYYPEINKVYFLPDGGRRVNNPVPYKERSIEVLYAGGCQVEQNFPDLSCFDDGGKAFYTETMVYMITNPGNTTEDAMEQVMKRNGCSFDLETMRYLNEHAATWIENQVRREFKIRAMQALDRAGIPVTVYGGFGWGSEEYTYSSVTFHERIPEKKCDELFANAKIILNFVPWFKEGSSERPFNSMLNGGVCVIDRNRYLESRFTDGKELVFFDLQNPEQLAADIKWLLASPEDAERIALAGMQAVTRDTWADRLDDILGYMNDDPLLA